LHTLVPKIAAPIRPHAFREFKISEKTFNADDIAHRRISQELKQGAALFERTGLYPKGKKIDELPFRHNFHRLIGKLHLDNRSGMSFGFFAHQMPTSVDMPILVADFIKKDGHENAFKNSDIFVDNKSGNIFVLFEIVGSRIVVKVPDVWVLSLRSGSDKTSFNPETDLLKLGLVNGEMWMEFPSSVKINNDYKPSFDTKVILAHAVGNALIASLARWVDSKNTFAENLKTSGITISHWHGYFNKIYVPEGLTMYGLSNPHVSCSSPQSAIYALIGKLKAFFDTVLSVSTQKDVGDIHIEPQHGINICYPSLVKLADFLLKNPEASALGNKYLYN